MCALRLAVVLLLIATPLTAQFSSTLSPKSAPAAAPRGLSLFFDAAGLFDGRPRAGFEALLLDGWTLGLAVSRTRTLNVISDTSRVCWWFEGCDRGWRSAESNYGAWSVDLALRSYPVALSFNRRRSLVAAYIGAYVGLHERTIRQSANLMRLGSPWPHVAAHPDVPIPNPGPPTGSIVEFPSTHRASSWEPGAEIGIRLIAAEPVFIDVGGSFTWVTNADPVLGLTTGRFDPRLVAAVGIGW